MQEGKVDVGLNQHSHQVEVVPMSKPGTKGVCSTTIGFADGDDYFCRLVAA